MPRDGSSLFIQWQVGAINIGGSLAGNSASSSAFPRARLFSYRSSFTNLHTQSTWFCAEHLGSYVSLFSCGRRSWARGRGESNKFPHQMEATMSCAGRTEAGMTCPSVRSGESVNPSEASCSSPAFQAPILPPGPPAGPQPLPARGRGKDARAGWRCCFPLCFTHNAPEKHFPDM